MEKIEKLTVSQLVKKLLTLRGTRMFITMFTKAWTGPYTEPDECRAPPCSIPLRSILISFSQESYINPDVNIGMNIVT
jgi:hypothetical protein